MQIQKSALKISEIVPGLMQKIAPAAHTAAQQTIYDQLYWEKVNRNGIVTHQPKKTQLLPWGEQEMPEYARFRCAVRFRNKKFAYYPSYDTYYTQVSGQRRQIYDEQMGLSKLYEMVNKEKRNWDWTAISIFLNITDEWARTDKKIFNYRLITWEPRKSTGHLMQLFYHNGKLDLPYMQMWVAQNNVKGYATAEERAPWESKYTKKY